MKQSAPIIIRFCISFAQLMLFVLTGALRDDRNWRESIYAATNGNFLSNFERKLPSIAAYILMRWFSCLEI